MVSRYGLAIAAAALLMGCDAYDASLLPRTPSYRDAGADQLPYVTLCGNGRLDPGEGCDTAIEDGAAGSCVSACPQTDPCSPQVPAGPDCDIECVGLRITKAVNGDGCCPEGAGPTVDSDCGFCGDKIVGPAETCDPPQKCAVAEACVARGACLVAIFTGDPATCSASCRVQQIEACEDDDGCCPAGCSAGSDNNCSASCGNGIVESEQGETCEPGDPDKPCPSDCDDGQACTSDVLTGSANNCNAQCSNLPITVAVDGDGCCLPGENSINDSDCAPQCGNEVLEAGETCDPCPANCDDQDVCTADQSSGSAGACTLVCSHVALSAGPADGCCPPGANANSDADCAPVCGNNIQEGSEKCDPCPSTCSDGIACTTDSSTGSAGACSLACSHSAITAAGPLDGCCPSGANATTDADCAPVCGNSVKEGSEKCDPCPSTCNDGVACTTDSSSGSAGACSLQCTHTTITAPSNGDACCPSGANAVNDSDCTAQCGNGVTEPGEQCDGGPLCRNCVLLFNSSLVHRYSFNGSGTTITDSVGTAHGTAINCSVANGAVDLQSSVTGDYVDLPNGLISGLSQVTFEVWLKWDGGDNRQHVVDFGYSSGGAGTSFFMLEASNGNGQFASYLNVTSAPTDPANDLGVMDSSALSQSGVHHIAVTFNGTRLSLFLDGVRQSYADGAARALSSIDDRNNWLGHSQFSGDPELDATLYEFRIYSKALTTAEITASYNAGQNP